MLKWSSIALERPPRRLGRGGGGRYWMTGRSVGRTPDYGSRRRPRDWQSNVGAVSCGLPLNVHEVDRARPKPSPVDRSHRADSIWLSRRHANHRALGRKSCRACRYMA